MGRDAVADENILLEAGDKEAALAIDGAVKPGSDQVGNGGLLAGRGNGRDGHETNNEEGKEGTHDDFRFPEE